MSHLGLESIVRHAFWNSVKDSQWQSWVWQQQNRIKSLSQLEKILELTPSERLGVVKATQFRMAITPYYASLIDPSDPACPIRRQCIPTDKELNSQTYEVEDPLAEEAHMPVPGLTHRYPDRALLYVSHHCPVYCRHCTRKRKVSDPRTAPHPQSYEKAFEYLRKTPEIKDVLVSGGDPLSLSDVRLAEIFKTLRKIPHIEIIRLSTRNLVTLPQRVTENLIESLKPHQPIYVHTHFNHPKECTLESKHAIDRFVNSGFVVNNQMVLLRGINTDPEVVKRLNLTLLRMRIQPYYMIHCDLASGLSHFRASIDDGLRILKSLRGRVSGMAIPHYVVDLTPGGGKVALTPEAVLSRKGSAWRFKNYQDKVFDYHDPEFHDLGDGV